MAKLRTHKATKKRYKATKNGIVKHIKAGWNHLKIKKQARIKYRKRKNPTLQGTESKKINKILKRS